MSTTFVIRINYDKIKRQQISEIECGTNGIGINEINRSFDCHSCLKIH